MTERIKEKLLALRTEADNAIERAEAAEGKIKNYDQVLLDKDHEITSLTRNLDLATTEVEKLEALVKELKATASVSENAGVTNEGLIRKVTLLEEELDGSEKSLKETVEKLRQVDLKAEELERQVARLEQERDLMEAKVEAADARYKKSQQELAELEASMADL